MQKNKDIILFTYDYPFGKSEKTFLEYELPKLSENFENIEIILQKKFSDESILDKKLKNIKINKEFANQTKLTKYFIILIKNIIFDKLFWKEFSYILFKKNFFKKLKMSLNEIILSYILYNYLKERKYKSKKKIFYSFWSNFTLLAFSKLKKNLENSVFISRALGSDLNGYIKNDNYVPYKKSKFSNLDKIILLGEYQKKRLDNLNLNSSNIKVCPLGVFKQKNKIENININQKLVFLSCGNLIEIKNHFLMIDFLERVAKKINNKVEFILIGDGHLKENIKSRLNNLNNLIDFKFYNYVENLVEFISANKIDFFLNFSSQEGMAFTIMESMSCGIPVIASDIDSNKYLVNNNGYLFDLENYKDSINEVINQIIFDIKESEPYLNKSKKSYNFINNNLHNEKCFNKFKEMINNI